MINPPNTMRTGSDETPPRHYPALDGMRAIAIVGVLALHYLDRAPMSRTGPARYLGELISYGEYGVDLFFVLSGFLITGILLGSRESPSYFRTFYIRRALRIFPLYYSVLLVLTVLVPALVPSTPDSAHSPYMSTWWFSTYFANWPISRAGWGVSPRTMPHFWTLAMEEQFYLVWPAVILAVPRRRLVALCVAMLAAAMILRALLLYRWSLLAVIPVNTLVRLDGLVMGAIVASWWSSRTSVASWKAAVRPFLAIVSCILLALRFWRGPLRLDDHATLVLGLPMISAMFASIIGVCPEPS
jgi:peptidoglycan/LPS O-acetylase OafA/YrhL